jgi:hypothetical protein
MQVIKPVAHEGSKGNFIFFGGMLLAPPKMWREQEEEE